MPPTEPDDRPLWRQPWLRMVLILAITVGIWMWSFGDGEKARAHVDYSDFYTQVEAGKVATVEIRGLQLRGTFKTPTEIDGKQLTEFVTNIPENDDSMMPLLHRSKVKIRVESTETSWLAQLLVAILPWLLLIGIWVWLSKRARSTLGGAGPLGAALKSKSRKFDKNTSVNVTFDDVAGLKSAKRDLSEVVQFLKEPEKFQRLGGKVPRGVLLVGPPGTGKTLLARAVAGEAGVPFYSITGSEFIEMFVGVGAARVRDLFEEAKREAPAIIFIDELDAVGRSRGAGIGGGHDEREQTLNQLLAEMDGFDRHDQTIVLAATNRPDVLDAALLRPGRFDRRVVVDRPELDARKSILKLHTKEMPLADDVDLDGIAASTPGFSGADLANLANEAALGATRRDADEVTAGDFATALDKVVLGDPREAKLDDEEKQRVAVHESGHALVARLTNHSDPLRRVSIIPRGMALGATQQTPPANRHLLTEAQLHARLEVLLAGYAAERVVFGSISTGAENDLKQATELATKMVAHYGMSQSLGPMYHEHRTEHPFLGQRIATDGGISDATTNTIEAEARRVLTNALQGATDLLTKRRDTLDRLVEHLIAKETLEGDDLDEAFAEAATAPARVSSQLAIENTQQPE